MPSSDRRIAANRANATRSTGPRTLGGKERAKMNAVTHGLTAQASVLPGEDPGELQDMARSLMRQLRPRGVVQRMMAERVVSLAWKLRRVARAEEAVGLQMEEASLRRYEEGAALAESQPIFRQFVGTRPERRDAGALLADSTWERGERHGADPRLRELDRLQKEADVFEDPGEDEVECMTPEALPARHPPAGAVEPTPRENEPTRSAVRESPEDGSAPEGDPGLRCAAPSACGEGPVEKTNPIPRDGNGSQAQTPQEVKPDSPAGSSAPAPRTSASPPPAPGR